MEEVWKPIPRFDNIIEASNLGGIRRVAQVVKSRGGVRTMKARKVTFKRHPWGYSWCEFMIHNVKYWQFVHRLVAEAFIGPCPEGYYVLHGDNDPTNNCIDNLRYGTPTENCADKLLHGTQPSGERVPWHKLKEVQVVEIRTRRAAGEKLADIARSYDVSEVYIWHICTAAKWPNAGGQIEPKTRRVNILGDDSRVEVIRMRREGSTIQQLASIFDTSKTQIHNLVRKFGL